MPHTDLSIPALLRARAAEHGDVTAYTFMDGVLDGTGYAESLTWSQVYRRSLVVAEELRRCGATGDRAAILAPQGLDYIVAFLGALQAGFIAVPLSVPQFGVHDLRVASALKDSAPVGLLTTSSVVTDVNKYASGQRGRQGPAVIEVDLLDSDSTRDLDTTDHSCLGPAYLQYTSGSTRTPAGVIVTHRNVTTNVRQAVQDYFDDDDNAPEHAVVVSWLPFYHDMGLIMGLCAPLVAGRSAVLMSPLAFLRKPASWMQQLASHPHSVSAAPNFAFELAVRRTSDADMVDLDLGHVQAILSGAERVHYATIKRFTERFAPFGLQERVLRPSYGLAEATLYVATPEPGKPVTTARFDLAQLSAGLARPCVGGRDGTTELVSYGAPRACLIRIVHPETGIEQPGGRDRRDLGARRQRRPGLLAQTGAERAHLWRTDHRSVSRNTGSTLATHRRPGSHLRRRAVHHGPSQRPADRRRPQPLSRRHRVDDPGDHRRPRRRDRRRRRRHREPRGDHRAEATWVRP